VRELDKVTIWIAELYTQRLLVFLLCAASSSNFMPESTNFDTQQGRWVCLELRPHEARQGSLTQGSCRGDILAVWMSGQHDQSHQSLHRASYFAVALSEFLELSPVLGMLAIGDACWTREAFRKGHLGICSMCVYNV
jgi:hypothetical protein